jgi:hypothetical protein
MTLRLDALAHRALQQRLHLRDRKHAIEDLDAVQERPALIRGQREEGGVVPRVAIARRRACSAFKALLGAGHIAIRSNAQRGSRRSGRRDGQQHQPRVRVAGLGDPVGQRLPQIGARV